MFLCPFHASLGSTVFPIGLHLDVNTVMIKALLALFTLPYRLRALEQRIEDQQKLINAMEVVRKNDLKRITLAIAKREL